MDDFDVVVLGAGSAGYATALRAAQLGLSVAMIEKDQVGGTCLHRGCIPTKAILHAAEVADAVRTGADFGVHAVIDRIDLAGVHAYADATVAKLYKGLSGLIRSREITVITGEGRLVPAEDAETPPRVAVGDRVITGRHLVLASGSEPRSLPGLEIDGHQVITSEHALRLERLPRSAIVLGGGVIGAEFASAWRSFGAEVTVIEALPRLLPSEEPEISTGLERAFRRRNITGLTGAPVTDVKVSDRLVRVTLETGRAVEAELLLVAVGRGPRTADLGYAEAGVELDRGFVAVTERLAASTPGTYAIGDLVAGLQLAHRGFAHGIFVAEEIAVAEGKHGKAPVAIRDRDIPRVTYCDPEVASVGLGEEAARAEYGDAVTVSYDLAGNGRSQILKTAGLVKLVQAPEGPVVGVHLLGSRVGELIGEAQLITSWEAYPEDVAGAIHAHPTQAEALGEAHLALAGKPLHVHG